MVLDDIKIVLGINGAIKDSLLNIYIRKATTLIVSYMNDPLTDVNLYPDAVIEYVTICINKKGNEGIKQGSQGSRSQTYGNDLPDSVKALLPPPFARMSGVTNV